MNRRAYTIVEVMVAIGIMTLMMAIAIGTYSFGKDHDRIVADSSKLVALIRSARNRDLGGIQTYRTAATCSILTTKVCPNGDECGAGEGRCIQYKYPQGGYGVRIVADPNGANYFILFADLILNTNAESDFNPDTDELIQQVNLPDTLMFQFDNTDMRAAEIVFTNGQMSVRQSNLPNGVFDDAPVGTYVVNVLPKGGCSSKKSVVSIEVSDSEVHDDLVDC